MKKDAQILQDVPAVNVVALGLVFGGSELAVYLGADLLFPTLALTTETVILAWGASLVVVGPGLGLATLYGLSCLAARRRPGAPPRSKATPPPAGLPGTGPEDLGDDLLKRLFPYDPDGLDMFDTETPYPLVRPARQPVAAPPLETVR